MLLEAENLKHVNLEMTSVSYLGFGFRVVSSSFQVLSRAHFFSLVLGVFLSLLLLFHSLFSFNLTAALHINFSLACFAIPRATLTHTHRCEKL